jgi:hypothetical protein
VASRDFCSVALFTSMRRGLLLSWLGGRSESRHLLCVARGEFGAEPA